MTTINTINTPYAEMSNNPHEDRFFDWQSDEVTAAIQAEADAHGIDFAELDARLAMYIPDGATPLDSIIAAAKIVAASLEP